jgi:hypothetical protein
MLLAAILIDSLGRAGRTPLSVVRILPNKRDVGIGSGRQFSAAPVGGFAKVTIVGGPDDVCSCSRARLVNSLYEPGCSQSAFSAAIWIAILASLDARCLFCRTLGRNRPESRFLGFRLTCQIFFLIRSGPNCPRVLRPRRVSADNRYSCC